jgi:hypothetical protein
MLSTQPANRPPFAAASLLSTAVLAITVLLNAAGAAAGEARDVPHISDIRLLRKLGEYDLAMGYLNTLMKDGSVPESIRKQAYNELVTIAYLRDGAYIARPIAQEAVLKYPDLETDPNHHPAEIQEIYESLKETMFGRLQITSYPDHCRVYLDGEDIGYTPLTDINVPAGEHTIRISAFGFADEIREISIDPGVVSEQFVTMRQYRAISKKGIGLEIGLGLASLKYEGAVSGVFAGLGPFKDYKSVLRFGGGIFFELHRDDRFALQMGLRYNRHGNRASYDLGDESGWEEYSSYFHYMAVPVLLKYYPRFKPGAYLFAGPEYAFLVSATLKRIGDGKPVAIMQNLKRHQMSLVAGLGMEIKTGNQTVMISASYTMGQLSLREDTEFHDVDFKPRELRVTVGVLFKGRIPEDTAPGN